MIKKKKMEIGDFRSLFAGRTVYNEVVPAIAGMMIVRTGDTYTSTMRALLAMDGKFSFKIIGIGRLPHEQRLVAMATKIEEFRNIIFEVKDEAQAAVIEAGLVPHRENALQASIYTLHLRPYVHNTLMRHQINSVGDIVKLTVEELSELRGIGDLAVKQIHREVFRLGLHFGMKGTK